MKDRLFEIWFSLRCGIANREFPAVLEQYGSPYAVFTADENELERMPCSEKLKRAFADKSLGEAMRILEYCREREVGLLFWQDPDYPASLRTLLDPPTLLYYTGTLPDFAHLLCISIVGTRKMSEYGKRMAYRIGYETAASGAVTVSGMALGIDSVAAAGAVNAKGKTVAVLGCGIDITYPSEHCTLREAIERGGGAVITEFPPSTPPEGRNFPIRNRIISGLSQGTVVVEADMRSGALITARTAILQGRDIFAVPGNVGDENTAGTNRLIRDGAAVALRARDILENYCFLYRDTLDFQRLTMAEKNTEPEQDVLERLHVHYRTFDPRIDRARRDDAHNPAVASHPAPPYAPSANVAPAPKPEAPARTADRAADRTSVTDSDLSEKTLSTLSETQRAIFRALPLDHAVPVDYLTREGFAMGDVMAAMTVLEIKGLVISLPGSLFARK